MYVSTIMFALLVSLSNVANAAIVLPEICKNSNGPATICASFESRINACTKLTDKLNRQIKNWQSLYAEALDVANNSVSCKKNYKGTYSTCSGVDNQIFAIFDIDAEMYELEISTQKKQTKLFRTGCIDKNIELKFKSLAATLNKLASSKGGLATAKSPAQEDRENICSRVTSKKNAEFLSAKDIQYSEPGSVAQHYGWNVCNISDIFVRAADINGTENQQNIYNSAVKYLGKHNIKLSKASPEQLVDALDYAVREEGRKQQTKSGFFDSVLGAFVAVVIKVGLNYVGVPFADQIIDTTLQISN